MNIFKLKEGFGWAKQQLGGIDINDPVAINNLMSKYNIDKNTIDKALKWGKGFYKGAKFLGQVPKEYSNIDVDKMENDARKFFNLDNKMPSYDARKVPAFEGLSYSTRASSLPD